MIHINCRTSGLIGTVQFSADDYVFYDKIEGIDDLVLYEGTIVPQLKKTFGYAVEDYMELYKKAGREAVRE